jgi:hypothetical protein
MRTLQLQHPALPGGEVTLAFRPGGAPLRIDTGGANANWDGAELHLTTTAAASETLAAAAAAIEAGMREAEAARQLGVDQSRTLRSWLGKAPR